MYRGPLSSSSSNLRARLRSTTALLIGALFVAPVAAQAEVLNWQQFGGSADGDWDKTTDRWQDNDANPLEDFEEPDTAVFGDINGGNGYTVNMNAAGNNKKLQVTDIIFDQRNVLVITDGNRSLEVLGAITVNDDGVGSTDLAQINGLFKGNGLTKDGDGVLELIGSNDNDLTGTITVDAGRLNIGPNVSFDDVSAVQVNSGGAIGGNGSVNGDVTIADGGTLQGALTLGGNLDSAGTIANPFGNNNTISGIDTFTNTGTIRSQDDDDEGSLTITADVINLNDGTVIDAATGTLDLDGDVFVNGSVNFTNTGDIGEDVKVASGATFTNVAGTSVAEDVESRGIFNMTGGTVETIDIKAGTGNFSGGNTTSHVDLGKTGPADPGEFATINVTGDFGVGGRFDINSDPVENTTLSVSNNATLTITENISATHSVAATGVTSITIADGSTINAIGGYQIGEDVDFDNAGTVAGGTFENTDSNFVNQATGSVTADFTNTSGDVTNFGDMSGTILITDGTLTNNGTISANGGGTNTVTLNGAGAALTSVPTVDPGTPSRIDVLVINTDGTVNAAGGDFAGGIRNADLVDVTANTTGSTIENETGGTVRVADGVTLDMNVDQTGNGLLDINNGTVEGNVTANAGTIALNGVIDGTVGLTGGATTIMNTGFATGAVRSEVTGLLTNAGTVNAADTDFTGGVLNNTGGVFNVDENISGTVTNDGGLVAIDATKTLDGALDNDNGTTTLAGIVDGNVTVGGGSVTNTGSITGTLMLDGGTYIANGTSTITGLTTNDGGTIEANGGGFGAGGIVNDDGTLNINTSYGLDVDANGGDVVVAGAAVLTGDFAQDGADTINDGQIVDNIAMTDGTLTNNGTLTGTVNVGGGTLEAQGGSNITGLVTVDGGTVEANGGLFDAGAIQVDDGTLEVNAATTANVTNDGGQVTMADVTLTGTYDNLSGDATLDGTITGAVTTDGTSSQDIVQSTADLQSTLTVNGGRFVANAGGTITGQATNMGGSLRLNGGSFVLGIDNVSGKTQVIGDTTANVENLGGEVRIWEDQTLTGTILNTSGDSFNEGTLNGSITVDAGLFRNFGVVTGTVQANDGTVNAIAGSEFQGVVTNAGANINTNGGTFGVIDNTAGKVEIRDDTSVTTFNNSGGELIVKSGDTLTSAVSITAGEVTNEGQIDGTVALTNGRLITEGNVTDDVTVIGATAELIANDGSSFDETVQSSGSGQVLIEGTTTGNFDNNGGALRIAAAGRINGNVDQQANVTNNNGVINGTVDVTGGTLNQRVGSNTTGLTTVSNGTLNLQGGAFGGGLLTTGGTFNMTGDTSGDYENDGATGVVLASGLSWTGDVTNTSGTMSIRSDVDGEVLIDAGPVTFTAASSVSGETKQRGGTVIVNGGSFDGDFAANGGLTEIEGDASGRFNVNGGDLRLKSGNTLDGRIILRNGNAVVRGTAGAGATAIGGDMNITGTIDGKLIVRGSADVTHTGTITGATVVRGGTLDAEGGSFDKAIEIRSGLVNINEDTVANINVTSGSAATDNLVLKNNKVLTGNVDNSGRFSLAGTLDGNLVNSGTTDFVGDGFVDGDLTNDGIILIDGQDTGFGTQALLKPAAPKPALTLSGDTFVVGGTLLNEDDGDLNVAAQNFRAGDVINRGAIQVTDGKVLLSEAGVSLEGTSTTSLTDGGLEATTSITAGADSTLLIDNSDVEAADGLISSGTTIVTGDTSIMFGDITLTDEADLTISGTLFDVTGTLDTGEDTETVLDAGSTLMTAGFAQAGNLRMSDGSIIEGLVTNTGVITGSGTLRFNDGLTSGGGTVNLRNGDTSDRVRIGGAGLDGGRFNLDIDLGTEDGTADRIIITDGVVTGDVELAFNTLSSGAQQGDGVLVLDVNGADVSGLSLSVSGLPNDDPLRLYGLSQNADGDVVVDDSLNPAVGGLAGSIVLTQSLIGSVVNRPSSPFVSGLALEDEDPCGAGLWARATGGQADTNGLVQQDGLPDVRSELEANYYGVQLGGDWACFNGFYNGWDMAFGGILGANFGDTTQPVFAPVLNLGDPDGEAENGELTSITDVTFQQVYGGVYATAVKGPLALDLQYRIEQTDYVANNTGQNGNQSLGLDDEEFTSESQTLSGAVSYAIPLEQYDLTFVPTAGFAYSTISTDAVTFENLGSVQIEDFESQVGFIGGTLARTKFGDDGVSAINQFVTATIYNDFAPDPSSTFTSADGTFTQEIVSENLGTYGEVSAGLNYVRILQPGEFGAVRQLNASVRADVRYSDQLESWGITAQARLQF